MKKLEFFLIFFLLMSVSGLGQTDAEVRDVLPNKGKVNNIFESTNTVLSRIRNNSLTSLVNLPVTIDIVGANPYTTVQIIPLINPGDSVSLTFSGIPINNTGNQDITVSVPADANNLNNSSTYNQEIYCDTASYSNNSPIIQGVGYDTGGGIIANRFVLPPSTLPLIVTDIGITIALGPTNTNNSIVGVLLDDNGVVVDSTNVYVISATDLGAKVDLSFIDGTVDRSGQTIYIGIRQIANPSNGFFPCATQDPVIERDSAYYGFGVNGGTGTIYSTLGAWMMDAVFAQPDFNVSSNIFGNTMCVGNQLTLNASPSGFDSYDFNIDGANIQSGPMTSYSYIPLIDTDYFVTANKNACTYVIPTVNVSVVNEININLDLTFCDGETYFFDGQNLATPGAYVDTLPSLGGCDSIVNLTLDFNPVSSLDIYDTICSGDSYFFANQTLTNPGTYSFTTTNVVNCDSTISLFLTVDDPDYTILGSICVGELYYFGSQTISSPGTYYRLGANPDGCDTLVTLELTVEQFTISGVTQSRDTLTVQTINAGPNMTYQWIDCDTGDPVTGATDSTFIPGLTGSYAVIVTQNDCSKTSDCFFVDYTSNEEFELAQGLTLYPNPATSSLNLESKSVDIVAYTIYDVEGRLILSKSSLSGINSLVIDIEMLTSGTYMIKVESNDAAIRKLFVKR